MPVNGSAAVEARAHSMLVARYTHERSALLGLDGGGGDERGVRRVVSVIQDVDGVNGVVLERCSSCGRGEWSDIAWGVGKHLVGCSALMRCGCEHSKVIKVREGEG